jgi:hypothetical protein
MNINVELGNGITIKVPSEKYYLSTDAEWEQFMQYNIVYPQHQWFIVDPFDDSALDSFKEDLDFDEDLDLDIDTLIDYNPNEWD